MRRFSIILVICFSTTFISSLQESSANNCIAIMGDSLPAGTFVALLPGTGVTVLQGQRMSLLLDDALQARELIQYGIYDLSLGASAITDINAQPYLTSAQFFFGRELNCRFVVIFPFLNDLYTTDDGDTGVTIYQTGLGTMLESIHDNSPNSQIVLAGFYETTLQGVGDLTYGDDVTSEHVLALNTVHQTYCEDNEQITCLDLQSLLMPIENYVERTISREDYETVQYTVVTEAEQTMVDNYWMAYPNNDIFGDGLHLNPAGQSAVIEALMQLFFEIDPLYFTPIFQ